MRKKLLFSYLIIIVIAIGVSGTAFWVNGYKYIEKQSKNYYLMQAEMIKETFENMEIKSEKDYSSVVNEYADKYNVRITLIDNEGKVTADSSIDGELENHATREEIVRALEGEKVSVTRYSKSMHMDYCYSAVSINAGDFKGVLRLSVPLSELMNMDQNLQNSVGWSLFLLVIAAVILAVIFTKYISNPLLEVTHAAEKISEGDYGVKIYTRENDQIGILAEAFNKMSLNLKVTMNSLKKRNVELEAMLGSMESGVVAIDDTNAVLFYNKAFAEISETKAKNLKGKSLYNIIRNSIVFDVIDDVRKTEELQSREGSLNLATDLTIRVIGTPLKNENEKTLGILILIDDITKIKKLENVRSEFVSNVTHELKTPLTSIRGFIDTLKNGAVKDEAVARRFLDIIDIEAERLYSLIQDILLLSEIESKRDYEKVSCDVDYYIKDVIELLKPNLSDKVKIIYEAEPYIRPYSCNPDRIKQLMINLLDNAIKYTEEGKIEISCKEENDKLVIKVQDTGIGMEEGNLSRIFERFYRVDKGRSRKQGGTGLGLSIVKHIVELYNGTIDIRSKTGEGTCFKISLPY